MPLPQGFAHVQKKVPEDVKELINMCLKDWRNNDLPWSQLKEGIAAFIKENCKTEECPAVPDKHDEYRLQLVSLRRRYLRVTHAHKRAMHYLFDSDTGDVGIAEVDDRWTCTVVEDLSMFPEDIVLAMMYSHLPEPTLM
jgi:hypothetical protein